MLEHTQVFTFAATAHSGQFDKAGLPYVFHPLAVANIVKSVPTFSRLSEELQSELVDAALLHDVLEDTTKTIDDIRHLGVSERTIMLVEVLTHREGESREDYIRRVAIHPIARIVKLADLAHNSSPGRLDKLDEMTKNKLVKKYAADIPVVCAGSPEDLEWVKTQTRVLD